MTDEKPVEPSAVFAADGTRVPYRRDPASAASPGVPGHLVPALIRAAASGPVLAASVLAVAGVVAVRAAEAAGRIAWRTAWTAVEGRPEHRVVVEGLEISWTRIEIRWPR